MLRCIPDPRYFVMIRHDVGSQTTLDAVAPAPARPDRAPMPAHAAPAWHCLSPPDQFNQTGPNCQTVSLNQTIGQRHRPGTDIQTYHDRPLTDRSTIVPYY